MENFKNKRIGEIVAQNINFANVFQQFGIDFCCGGDQLLSDAVQKSGADLEEIIERLEEQAQENDLPQALDFNQWSLDLLIDYLLKFQHHYIRTNAPDIYNLLEKVTKVHGDTDKQLHTVRDLFGASLMDLHNHLDKEEQVLFPLIQELLAAKQNKQVLPISHCGSVQNPISVMMSEHDNEGERFREISRLTNGYTPPEHACNSYQLVLSELKQFEENLHIHIHLENNILFPKAIKLEESWF